MTLRPREERPLPLGTITPTGWLKRQLRVQADGLSGHLDELWPDVRDSGWIGGEAEGWERGPYWLDGLVPLAFLLGDERLIGKAHHWIGYIVEHQHDDGWIGPEAQRQHDRDTVRDPWPLFVALKAMTQYHEATGDERVLHSIARTVWAIDRGLDHNPLSSWAQFRWQDLLVTLLWLAERGEDRGRLGALAHRIRAQGYDWAEHFANFRFPGPADHWQFDSHVVNNAMGIKAPALWHAAVLGECDKAAALAPIEVLERFHGQASGVFTGDECLAGRHPSRGTELCAVVEYLFSLENLLSICDDVRLSDRLERIAFNALPATFTPDMWAHQYDQQANQAMCVRSDPSVFATNGPEANLYGLAPNYGCCTANMHQGFPKLASRLAMQARDGSMRLTSLLPSTIESGSIRIEIEGEYPFDDRVRIRAASTSDHELQVRFPLPGWAVGATIEVDASGVASPQRPGSLYSLSVPARGSLDVAIHLPMPIKVDYRYNRAASVSRGPLLYALRVADKPVARRGQAPTIDWEMHPQSKWNLALALDPDDPVASLTYEQREVAALPFDPASPPSVIHGRGSEIEWKSDRGAAAEPPESPVACGGEEGGVELVPYGATNLRIAEMPWYEKG